MCVAILTISNAPDILVPITVTWYHCVLLFMHGV